jgi:nucleolar protein 4
VDFVDAASASRAIEAAGKVEGGGVKVAGRRLNIALAVSATDAADLATAKSKAFATDAKKRRDGPRDNRNLYLATEGQIHEEGPAAQGVSREDIMKRRRAKEEQKMKLKNPNFFISKNRLQVRNVPPEVDQKQLKKIFHDAVLQRATKANPKVLHARLLFDNTRPDANGKPRSRGIGFVEFDAHDHALAALRTLNNNPTIFTAAKRPIVEFAVEDARAVKKLERRRDGLNKAQRERTAAEGEEGKKPGPKADRTARRIQKRKERKEDRKAAAAAARGGGDGDGGGGGDDGEENPAAAAKKKTKKKRKVEEPKPKQPRQARASQKQKQKQKPQRSREPRRDRDEDLINDADLGPAPKKRRGGERRDRVDDLVDMYFGKR